MIYPSVDELAGDKYNRYILCIATAKCARMISNESMEKSTPTYKDMKEEKSYKKLVDDRKPVQLAINRFYSGRYKIILPKQ